MPNSPVIELPKRTRLVFSGGAEKTIPLSPNEFRALMKQAGQQGALFVTVPLVAGTPDMNITTLCYFEQDWNK